MINRACTFWAGGWVFQPAQCLPVLSPPHDFFQRCYSDTRGGLYRSYDNSLICSYFTVNSKCCWHIVNALYIVYHVLWGEGDLWFVLRIFRTCYANLLIMFICSEIFLYFCSALKDSEYVKCYVPMCCCLISKYPYFNLFKDCLSR